jgi:hypothetical protein
MKSIGMEELEKDFREKWEKAFCTAVMGESEVSECDNEHIKSYVSSLKAEIVKLKQDAKDFRNSHHHILR